MFCVVYNGVSCMCLVYYVMVSDVYVLCSVLLVCRFTSLDVYCFVTPQVVVDCCVML